MSGRAVAVGVTLEEAVAALQAAVVARAGLTLTTLPLRDQAVVRIGDVELHVREAEVVYTQERFETMTRGDADRRYGHTGMLHRTEVRLVVFGCVPAAAFRTPLSVSVAGYRFQMIVTRAETRCAPGSLVEQVLYGVSIGQPERGDEPAQVDAMAGRAISLDGVPCRR